MDEQRKIETIYGNKVEVAKGQVSYEITEHIKDDYSITIELDKVNIYKFMVKLEELCKSEIK
jgi:hypothetical protein